MGSAQRRKAIYDLIRKQGEIRVNDLINNFNVSGMTIRRDLKELESMNMIRRSYSKAYIEYSDSIESSYILREIKNKHTLNEIIRNLT